MAKEVSRQEQIDELERIMVLSGDTPRTSEEAQARAIVKLTESNKAKGLTQLTDPEIKNITRINWVANMIDSDFLRNFVDEFIEFRVSLERQGRGEIVEVAQPKVISKGGILQGLQ